MGAANIVPNTGQEGDPLQDNPTISKKRTTSASSSGNQYSLTQLSTIRLICKTDSALQAFLCFLSHQSEIRQAKANFFQSFLYIESDKDLFQIIGTNYDKFQNYSESSHLIHDDPASSVDFLRKLQRSERYLMVLSVICVLNDFMRSEWHTVWQEIEMQSADPAPQVFPSVYGRIYDKFSSYDNELQYFLRTTEAKNVSDLLVCCLKHLPFPLVVMAMNSEQKWFPITSANEAFEELTGYTEDEVKGLTMKVMNPELDKDMLYLIRDQLFYGVASRIALTLTKKNGEVMRCVLGVIPIFDNNHSILNFLALLDDITVSDYCLTRLKIFSDLLDSITSDINISPMEDNPFFGTSVGHMI